MGESFLRKQAQSFVRQMDKAHQTHIQTPNLFTDKDESIRREFSVSCGTHAWSSQGIDFNPADGDEVVVCVSSNQEVFVIHGNRRLHGFFPDDQSYLETLNENHPELGGMIRMEVTKVTELGDLTLTPIIDVPTIGKVGRQ